MSGVDTMESNVYASLGFRFVRHGPWYGCVEAQIAKPRPEPPWRQPRGKYEVKIPQILPPEGRI